MQVGSRHWSACLPFYYGWLIVGIAFVTMAIGVTARTAFSLLMPPLIDEFGWDRGSRGRRVLVRLPGLGGLEPNRRPRHGPARAPRRDRDRRLLLAAGLLLAPAIETPWHLYATLGVLVGARRQIMTYTVHSLVPAELVRAAARLGDQHRFLRRWCRRHRTAALAADDNRHRRLARVVLGHGPVGDCRCWLHSIFLYGSNPRTSDCCLTVRHRWLSAAEQRAASNVVDPAWAAIEWTLGARRPHQALLVDRARLLLRPRSPGTPCRCTRRSTSSRSASGRWWQLGRLGIVSVVGIPGQISLGALSDRIGREWVWTAGCAGFAICYAALIALEQYPSSALLYLMVISQGFFGYALTSVMGPIVVEIFEGPHYGSIFGTITVALIGGGAAGPWVTGVIHDVTGSYWLAFAVAIVCCVTSAAAIWIAAPRNVRLVPGRMPRK